MPNPRLFKLMNLFIFFGFLTAVAQKNEINKAIYTSEEHRSSQNVYGNLVFAQATPSSTGVATSSSRPNFPECDFFEIRKSGVSDSNWVRSVAGSIITLPAIDSGNHILNLRYRNCYGKISESSTLVIPVKSYFSPSTMQMVLFALFFAVLGAAVVYLRSRINQKKQRQISKQLALQTEELRMEKEKLESMLGEMMPKEMADEKRNTGKSSYLTIPDVTVLFSDIQGFTQISSHMNPELLLEQLEKFFIRFDEEVGKYKIEKIKTIGDAYMCAGGLRDKNLTNSIEVTLAALEMMKYLEKLKSQHEHFWDLRIGIHTGQIIAGAVGLTKVQYDIWGDTVNTASRMQSLSEPGRINVSGVTYELIKGYFECEYRGKMPVKGLGELDMYFVNGIRRELATPEGNPSEHFFIKLQLQRLADLEEKYFDVYKRGLTSKMYFNNYTRVRQVYQLACEIGEAEKLSDSEQLIVRTAALFLFYGLLFDYVNLYKNSIKNVQQILPEYRYTKQQIDQICRAIASVDEMVPLTLTDKVLNDAAYMYLGSSDYIELQQAYYLEYSEYAERVRWEQWIQKQIDIQQQHHFFTETGQKMVEIRYRDQIKNLKSLHL